MGDWVDVSMHRGVGSRGECAMWVDLELLKLGSKENRETCGDLNSSESAGLPCWL